MRPTYRHCRCLLPALLLMMPATGPAARGFDHLVALSNPSQPEREQARDAYRFRRAVSFTDVAGLRYMHYSPGKQRQVVGFQLVNQGSPRINPTGLRGSEATREYRFTFPDRARQEIHLLITDDTRVSGRYSQDNMFREMLFFPRRYLPTVTTLSTGKTASLEVALPTGETVTFDARTLEITGGVLAEQPIDRNRNRHARQHPRVRYTGNFIAVSSGQRGESARRAKVWGQKRFAEIHYPAKYPKPCRVSRAEIWDQSVAPGNRGGDPRLTMLYPTDREFYAFVERRCGWDLTGIEQNLPEPRPMLRLASSRPPPESKPVVVIDDRDEKGLFGWFNRTFGAGTPPSSE